MMLLAVEAALKAKGAPKGHPGLQHLCGNAHLKRFELDLTC